MAILPIDENHRLSVLSNINRAYLSKWNHDQIRQHLPLSGPSTLHPEANYHTAVVDDQDAVPTTSTILKLLYAPTMSVWKIYCASSIARRSRMVI